MRTRSRPLPACQTHRRVRRHRVLRKSSARWGRWRSGTLQTPRRRGRALRPAVRPWRLQRADMAAGVKRADTGQARALAPPTVSAPHPRRTRDGRGEEDGRQRVRVHVARAQQHVVHVADQVGLLAHARLLEDGGQVLRRAKQHSTRSTARRQLASRTRPNDSTAGIGNMLLASWNSSASGVQRQSKGSASDRVRVAGQGRERRGGSGGAPAPSA